MDVKWDYKIDEGYHYNPILNVEENVYSDFVFLENDLLKILTNKGSQLKTWGGASSTSDPHWIGVKKSTALHVDPKYPRYTYHLILKVDDFALRGINKEELILKKGMLIELDTHSPHQLISKKRGATYYLAASIDSNNRLDLCFSKEKLITFVKNNPTLLEDTKRITK